MPLTIVLLCVRLLSLPGKARHEGAVVTKIYKFHDVKVVFIK